jgi:hypothetical protein
VGGGSRDEAGLVAAAPLTGVLPEVLDGHWTTAEGRDMAERYAAQPRSAIGFADHTDFALANAVFMADRNSIDLIVMQTAAKDRIRWLSANLAAAREYVEIANRDLAKVYSENQTLTTALEEARARCIALHEALTPSAETKAAYIGEVKFSVSTGFDEDGCEIWQDITVPWTTTKDIMAMILGHAAMSAHSAYATTTTGGAA